jgi:hypothetical protein
MAQPSPQKEAVKPDGILIIKNKQPDSKQLRIPSQGVVSITNRDDDECLIQLWDSTNVNHPALCLVIPAGGNITLMGDPDAKCHNADCYYNVLLPRDALGAGTGGGNKIIIGSGGPVDSTKSH